MDFLKFIPYSLHWIIRSLIRKDVTTILDLGCGDGTFTTNVANGENWEITGVELYENSIKKAKKKQVYKKIIKADILNLPTLVTNKKYDVVLAIQIIEHLSKKDAEYILDRWEKLARKEIIISTPVGFMEFDRVECRKDKNPLQRHLSGWQPEEFRKRGYRVYGQGLKLIYGKDGLVRKLHPISWPFLILFSYLVAPIVYLFPNIGAYMIAVKVKA